MPIKIGSDLPDLAAATQWFNGQVTRDALVGHPTLIHFWAVSCGICSEQMPQVKAWRERYEPLGLKAVGIHMPRSERDTEIPLVEQAIADYGLTHPIAVDNSYGIVDSFENKYVPAFYIFDSAGHLRHYQAGERGLPMIEQALERVVNKPHA
ncbi:MAG: redoxin domain-containing protein [Candidatus Xenobia bacterium]